MEKQEFKKLKRGDVVRHIGLCDSYVVDDNYGGFVIAVRTMCMANPSEWEKGKMDERIRRSKKGG